MQVPEWLNQKQDAHVVDKLQQLETMKELQRSAEKVNAKVIEEVDQIHID